MCKQLYFLFFLGNYRTQLYDKQKEEYLPATQGLGMFVEVKDPDEKVGYYTLQLVIHFIWYSLRERLVRTIMTQTALN